MRIECTRASLAVALLVAVSPLAQAQMGFNQIGNNGKPAAPAAKIAPPPALPGAESNRPVVPATRPPTDMEPTDALFDAINRGDIGTARDAISRGADMRGQNVLGMTPLELSVDLGRNDISFMLLSMRAGDDDRGRQPRTAVAAAKPASAKQARQATPHPARVAVAAPTPAQTARLFSGDGGSPNPNAGFLGFDTSRR
jgi:hypothetical protein